MSALPPIATTKADFPERRCLLYPRRGQIEDAVSVQADGTFNKEKEIGEVGRKHFDGMIINVKTGAVSYPRTGILETRVVQKSGPDDKNYVLVPSLSFRRNKTVANAAGDFIRLHGMADSPHFIAFWLSYLVVGTCEIVR